MVYNWTTAIAGVEPTGSNSICPLGWELPMSYLQMFESYGYVNAYNPANNTMGGARYYAAYQSFAAEPFSFSMSAGIRANGTLSINTGQDVTGWTRHLHDNTTSAFFLDSNRSYIRINQSAHKGMLNFQVRCVSQ